MLAFDVLQVEVGSKAFPADGPWAEYITDQLVTAFDKSAKGVEAKALEFAKGVTKYVEHFHGTKRWNGQLVNNSNRLQRRSGETIEAFKRRVKVETGGSDTMDFAVSHDMGMFGIHLDGGTIRARRSKYLTLPLPAACDRRGVPLKKSARDWPNTFVIRSKRGNLLIVQKNGSGGITPLYLLKTSVRIPARLRDFPKVWDSYVNRLEKQIIDVIEQAIDNIRW